MRSCCWGCAPEGSCLPVACTVCLACAQAAAFAALAPAACCSAEPTCQICRAPVVDRRRTCVFVRSPAALHTLTGRMTLGLVLLPRHAASANCYARYCCGLACWLPGTQHSGSAAAAGPAVGALSRSPQVPPLRLHAVVCPAWWWVCAGVLTAPAVVPARAVPLYALVVPAARVWTPHLHTSVALAAPSGVQQRQSCCVEVP